MVVGRGGVEGSYGYAYGEGLSFKLLAVSFIKAFLIWQVRFQQLLQNTIR